MTCSSSARAGQRLAAGGELIGVGVVLLHSEEGVPAAHRCLMPRILAASRPRVMAAVAVVDVGGEVVDDGAPVVDGEPGDDVDVVVLVAGSVGGGGARARTGVEDEPRSTRRCGRCLRSSWR